MSAQIIDGKEIAEQIKHEVQSEVLHLKKRGCTPHLSVVLVGENPASEIYVKMKTRTCHELGIESPTLKFPSDISQRKLLSVIHKLNEDGNVHGILVQLPLPDHINENNIIHAIAPEKDVDGFHPINRGKLMVGEDTFIPCTPAGIQQLLVRSGYDPAGRHVVIVGRSKIVGLPLAILLMQKKSGANATVTVCHTGTENLDEYTRQADILVAAMGRPQVIKGDMIKPGTVVIDVGVNRVEDSSSEKGYRIVGDVNFDEVRKKAAAITPVPGGVGPMTIAMLMYNTVKAAKQICASSSTG